MAALTWRDTPAGFNWGLTAQGPSVGPSDPTKGTEVSFGNGTYQQFAPGENPKIYMGDAIPGGIAAAVPGSPEASHLENLMRRDTIRSTLKIAGLVGGAAALGGTSWGSGGGSSGYASGTSSITDSSFGSVAGGGSSLLDPAAGNVATAVGGSGGASTAGWGPAFGTIGSGPPAAGGGLGSVASSLLGGGGSGMGGVLDFLPTIVNGGLALLGQHNTQNSIDNAVNATNQSTQAQIDYARETRDLLLKQAQPWTDAANSALPKLLQLAGISNPAAGGGLNTPGPGQNEQGLREDGPNGLPAGLTTDPSYKWRLSQSMDALQNSAAARGGLMSGGFAKSALDLAGNMASQEYNNIFNRVATIAGYAPLAMNATGSALTNATSTITNALGNQGNTLASAFIGSGNTNANMLNQLANIFGSNWKTFTHGNSGGNG